MEMNHNNGILYIADTGAGRIIWVNTDGPGVTTNIMGDETQMEPLAEYSEVTGVEWGILDSGLSFPSGIAPPGVLFISQVVMGRLPVTTSMTTEKASLTREQ